MSNLKNKSFEIRTQVNNVESLMFAADMLADHISVTGEKREEVDRFLALFYMAVDATRELKAMTEDL